MRPYQRMGTTNAQRVRVQDTEIIKKLDRRDRQLPKPAWLLFLQVPCRSWLRDLLEKNLGRGVVELAKVPTSPPCCHTLEG